MARLWGSGRKGILSTRERKSADPSNCRLVTIVIGLRVGWSQGRAAARLSCCCGAIVVLSVVAGINVLLEQRRACEVYSEARQEVRQAQG